MRRTIREKVVALQCWVRTMKAAVVVSMQRRRQEATRIESAQEALAEAKEVHAFHVEEGAIAKGGGGTSEWTTTRQNREAEAATGTNTEAARQASEKEVAAPARGHRRSEQLGSDAGRQGLAATTVVMTAVGIEPGSTAGMQGDGGRPRRCANSEWVKEEVRRREAARDAALQKQEAKRQELGGVHGMEEKAAAAKAAAETTAETAHKSSVEAQLLLGGELGVSQRQKQAEHWLEAKLGGVEARPTEVTAKRVMHRKEAESSQVKTKDRLKTWQQRRENGVGVLL